MKSLILFPGLGADKRLFHHQLDSIQSVSCPAFMKPSSDESLAEYAERFAGFFKDRKDYVIGGMSFGGILALEMSRHLDNCSGVLLISSFRNHEAIDKSFRDRVRMIQAMPDSMLRWAMSSIGAGLFATREGLKEEHKKLLVSMSEEADLDFFRWSSKASAEWVLNSKIEKPVFQIHGRNDYIAPSNQEGIDVLIEDGKHLIQFTHADTVNEHIQKFAEAV